MDNIKFKVIIFHCFIFWCENSLGNCSNSKLLTVVTKTIFLLLKMQYSLGFQMIKVDLLLVIWARIAFHIINYYHLLPL